jgi:hypothetical protein
MINVAVILFLSLISQDNPKQDVAPEQVALDFFLTEIFQNKYPLAKRIFVSDSTLTERSSTRPVRECVMKSGSDFYKIFPSLDRTDTNSIKLSVKNLTGIKFLKHSKKRKFIIQVNGSVRYQHSDYVDVTVYLIDSFVDHYLIKVQDEKAIDYCYVNELI